MTSPIQAAAVRTLPEPRPLEELAREVQEFKDRQANLMPVEGAVHKALEKAINERMPDFAAHGFIDRGWARLDLEVLRWRDSQGLPVLVPFHLNQPSVKITKDRGMVTLTPSLHESLYWSCYRDLDATIGNWLRLVRGDRVTYTATWPGAIPQKTRAIVRELASEPRLDMRLLADVPWVITDFQAIPKPIHFDPLLVGWDGHNLWLLDQFDLTPVERYALLEFSDLPKLTAGNPEVSEAP